MASHLSVNHGRRPHLAIDPDSDAPTPADVAPEISMDQRRRLDAYLGGQKEAAVPLSYRMHGSTIITTAYAQLEWVTAASPIDALQYDRARYSQSSTADGWWHRTFALDPMQWLRLSGTPSTTPSNALRVVLMEDKRSALTLPVLIVALFLAHSTQPDSVEQRHALRGVLRAIPDVLHSIPLGALRTGWDDSSPKELDNLIPSVIDALLNQADFVPWVVQDGLWAHVLDHLATTLWLFPPQVVQQIVASAAVEKESEQSDRDTLTMPGWAVLGYLSGMRFWHEPRPTIRNLPIHASMHEFLQIWQQALVIMDPAAPRIEDSDLAWLCDGTVGTPHDGPFDTLRTTNADHGADGRSSIEWQTCLAALQTEATHGMWTPDGRWDMPISLRWPLLLGYGFAAMRIVAAPEGLWVRFRPAQQSWGSIVWWRPEIRPPLCWTLALNATLTNGSMLGLHATLWQLWGNLRVYGRPMYECL